MDAVLMNGIYGIATHEFCNKGSTLITLSYNTRRLGSRPLTYIF